MTKQDYLAALARALADLPPQTVAGVVADYAQRFDAAVAEGKSEHEVARSMPNPGEVASSYWRTARSNARASQFDVAQFAAVGAGGHFAVAPSGPARFARVASSALGLFVLNLCMMIPAMIYSILLCTGLIVSLAVYGSGIVLTSAGAAGADGVSFGVPHKYLMVDRDEQLDGTDDHALEGVNEVRIGNGELRFIDHRPGQADAVTVGHSKLPGLDWVGTASRPTQVAGGVALVLTGILMLLAWLLAAKYSIIAVRQYVGLNIAALRAN